jgi:hypothetical protein
MILLAKHKKTEMFHVLEAAFPANGAPCWVRPDGLIAGKIGRRLSAYEVLHIFFKKEVRGVYNKEKLKDLATALGGIKTLLEDMQNDCLVSFGKDYGINEAVDRVRQSCTDVVVDIEGK